MKKVFSLIVSFVLCILCYPANILPVVAEDGEQQVYKRSYIATLYSDYNMVSITTITRYTSGRIHFSVMCDNDSSYSANAQERYKISFLNYYVIDDELVKFRTTHDYSYYMPETPMTLYGDEVQFIWSSNHSTGALHNAHLIEFDMFIKQDYINEPVYVHLFNYDGTYMDIEILSDSNSDTTNELDLIREELETYKVLYEESEAKLKALKADNEYKDKIINTKEETIIALRSQVEYWEKHYDDTDEYDKYDIDGDGYITITDAVKLFRFLAEIGE